MLADPDVLPHEKLMLRSAVEDLGTPLERLADKIKGDPFDDMALWFALRAAFVITSHTSPNPIIERIRQDLVKERAARARQGRELGSKKIDDVIRCAAENAWKQDPALRERRGKTAAAIADEVNRELNRSSPLKIRTIEARLLRHSRMSG